MFSKLKNLFSSSNTQSAHISVVQKQFRHPTRPIRMLSIVYQYITSDGQLLPEGGSSVLYIGENYTFINRYRDYVESVIDAFMHHTGMDGLTYGQVQGRPVQFGLCSYSYEYRVKAFPEKADFTCALTDSDDLTELMYLMETAIHHINELWTSPFFEQMDGSREKSIPGIYDIRQLKDLLPNSLANVKFTDTYVSDSSTFM